MRPYLIKIYIENLFDMHSCIDCKYMDEFPTTYGHGYGCIIVGGVKTKNQTYEKRCCDYFAENKKI